MRQALETLLARRQQPGRILLLIAALPLVLTGFAGVEYGAFAPYAILASICLVQAFYPTLLGWGLVVAVYTAGSAVYLCALARDVIRVARGEQAEILLGPADSTVFVLLELVLLAIDVALVHHRPKPLRER